MEGLFLTFTLSFAAVVAAVKHYIHVWSSMIHHLCGLGQCWDNYLLITATNCNM